MSFGGSAAAMVNSIKSNRALVKGRNHLFDREVKRSYGTGEHLPEAAPVSLAVRNKFREKLAQEKRAERIKWGLTVAVFVLLGYLFWNYGGLLYSLIVYQPGVP